MKSRVIVVVVLLAAAVAGVLGWRQTRHDDTEGRLLASGTVEATEAHLGFESGGRLATVLPREGDRVTQGERIATLDAVSLSARRDEAEARVAQAEAALEELLRGSRDEEIARARAELAAARDRLRDVATDLDRTRTLVEGGAASRESLDKALLARELATSRVEQVEQGLRLLESGPRPERIEAQRAVVRQAQAALSGAEDALARATLEAPFSGSISVRHREPGETVAPGTPVVTLLDPADRWVRIYVPEDRIGAVSLGASAEIRSDTHPDAVFSGEVTFLADEAEFTPKNVQTREERVRLVYAAKIRITRDPEHYLKPGMPVDVTLVLAPPPPTTRG